MDLSKLPRLSQTDKHAPPPQRSVPEYHPVEPMPASPGLEAWISIGIGALLLLMSSRFWSFAVAKLFGRPFTWTFSDSTGAPMAYTQTVFFLGDLAMVLFGFVLIAEGIVFAFSRSRPLVIAAFVLTSLTTLFNLFYLIMMMQKGFGVQFISAFAVIFGVYIAASQWRMLQILSGTIRR